MPLNEVFKQMFTFLRPAVPLSDKNNINVVQVQSSQHSNHEQDEVIVISKILSESDLHGVRSTVCRAGVATVASAGNNLPSVVDGMSVGVVEVVKAGVAAGSDAKVVMEANCRSVDRVLEKVKFLKIFKNIVF